MLDTASRGVDGTPRSAQAPAASLLETIQTPTHLRRLDAHQLDRLADEIRRTIIDTVASTGGHLGSNLGAVELTIALHRVLDSPTDAIIWDTGHQAYTHKLLTGRSSRFRTLRQAEGLSGYPSRSESPHDWVENSHASTALAYAYGLAAARTQAGDCGRVVAVVGDGALTGGMAYEGLNNIGWRQLPVVVVLNDNGRSYAPTVSKLLENLGPVRLAGGAAVGTAGQLPGARSDGAALFEALGVGYLGPVDGHDIGATQDALEAALQAGRPVVVHVLTRKGRGFAAAEDDDDKCLHDVAPFRPSRYEPPQRSLRRYTDVFAQELIRAGEGDQRVVAITAAMPSSTGLQLFAERFPDRFFDVGIAEQHAVTAAAGMAMGGLRPVVAIYSTFLSRAFDQLNLDVGLHALPVVFCVDRAGITGPDGPSHHGVLDLALLSRIPGMTVFTPSSGAELEVMLAEALSLDGPSALRWPNGTVPDLPATAVGRGRGGRKVREGNEVCIVAVGPLVEAAETAAELLEGDGVSSTVWDARVIKPFDPELVADAARHRLVVSVEDGVREGGAGSRLVDEIHRRGGPWLVPAMVVLGVADRYVAHGDPAAIRTSLGLDGPGIANAARSALAPDAAVPRRS